MERKIYLENMPIEEALSKWLALCKERGVKFPLGVEIVDVRESLGRITAEPIFAKTSSPPFHSSAMDGIAVHARSTYGASESKPVKLRLGEEGCLIDTGKPIPAGFDAVVKIEDVNWLGEDEFELRKPAVPWQHMRPVGEDIVATELVLTQSHRICATDIGALMNAGISEVLVRKKPIIAVIPTGSELTEDTREISEGKVIESNSWAICSLVSEVGGIPQRSRLYRDNYEEIKGALIQALPSSDAVVINAGTSAGREDYTRSIISEIGEICVHGVAMKPGKPTILGIAGGKPVVGLPGFPVANWRAAEEFLVPLISEFLGQRAKKKATLKAKLARRISSSSGFDEFVQVMLGKVNDKLVAVPLARGSGISMSLVRSDGYVRIPLGKEGLEHLDEVDVLLKNDDVDPESTILSIGSHDILLDLLSNRLMAGFGVRLASANVGSMGGIVAVYGGHSHLAGIHLFDPETGDFNVPYIKKQFKRGEVVLMNLSWREQGLIVRPGNPKGINGISDLKRKDIIFINRQKGSGTRILLDYELKRSSINPDEINGYTQEVFTHTSVAVAVLKGVADAGLGIYSAAKSLGLDFIPVAKERYDLLCLSTFADTDSFIVLRQVIKSPEFKKEAEELGGYDLSDAGNIIPL